MKTKENLKELRELSIEGLKEKVASTERELLNLRFRHSAGQLQQSSQLKKLRRQIAQTKTVLGQKTAEQAKA